MERFGLDSTQELMHQDSDESVVSLTALSNWKSDFPEMGNEELGLGLYMSSLSQEEVSWNLAQDMNQQPSSTVTPHQPTCTQQTGCMPSDKEFRGDFGFSLVVRATNTKELMYSEKLKKVFVKQDFNIPIEFLLDFASAADVLDELKIRALLVFTGEDRRMLPVNRCLTHRADTEDMWVNHVLRCCSPFSDYIEDSSSKRFSVSIPVERPQAGSLDSIMENYKCVCCHSCIGGINRNDVAIIFTLELRGEVIGRCTLPIRVCSCPKRDMEKAEKNKEKEESAETCQRRQPKKRKLLKEESSSDDGDDIYSLKIKGRENFELLSRVYEKMINM